MSVREGDFATPLCTCKDANITCCSWWCPCVQIGRNASDVLGFQGKAAKVSSHCWGQSRDFCLALWLPCSIPCFACSQQYLVVEQFHYRPRDCGILSSSMFCPCLAIARVGREFQQERDHLFGEGARNQERIENPF